MWAHLTLGHMVAIEWRVMRYPTDLERMKTVLSALSLPLPAIHAHSLVSDLRAFLTPILCKSRTG